MTIWNLEITASESPQTVHIPLEGKYYAIKNTGDHDILVSSYVASPTEGADDVMKIPSGSAAVIPVKDGDLYVSAEEDGTYSVSIQDDKVVPWSGGTGSGGGSGGGYSETVLYTNALANDPETSILLSDSYTNYDSLCVCLGKKNSMWLAPYTICKSLMSNGAQFGLSDEVGYANIALTDATHITRLSATSDYGVYIIIGIKY